MSTDALKLDAENCIKDMYEAFCDLTGRRRHVVAFPLTDLPSCHDFSLAVTLVLHGVRGTEAPLPPTALILTMIRVCQSMINPPSGTIKPARSLVPRAFAYELLDRLRAELVPTVDTAMDHLGRILTDAGTMRDGTRLRQAFQTYQIRLNGAFLGGELKGLLTELWRRHFPESLGLLNNDRVQTA